MKARAGRLLVRLDELGNTAATGADMPPLEPTFKPVRQVFEASRQELFRELKQSLHDLETLRMTPQDDPAVRELSADIRKTIAQAATDSPTSNRPAPNIPKPRKRT